MVNAVLPATTRSEAVAIFIDPLAKARGSSVEQPEAEFFRTVPPTSLVKRFEGIGEVANMAVFVCTPAATGTTGAAIRVDGGLVKTMV